jgi:hypothetical protein
VAAAVAASVTVDLGPGDVLFIPPLTPHHVECLGDGGEAGGHCVGLNVFSTGAFSKLIGQVQLALAEEPLQWLNRMTPHSLAAVSSSGTTDEHLSFKFSLLQYGLTELADRLGLDLGQLVANLLERAWAPLREEGAPEALAFASHADASTHFGNNGMCTVGGSGGRRLHRSLREAFGDERKLLKGLAASTGFEKLASQLEDIGAHLSSVHAMPRASAAAAMVAVFEEVVEGQVTAAMGLSAAHSFLAACLADAG